MSEELPRVPWSENDAENRKTMFDMIHSLSVGARSEAFFRVNYWAQRLLRGMMDDDGHFLWQSPLASGEPNRFAGFPVVLVDSGGDEIVARIAIETTWTCASVTPDQETPTK